MTTQRFTATPVHGEHKTIYACGDDNTPQASTFGTLGFAQSVVDEANDAEMYRARYGAYPNYVSETAWGLIQICNGNVQLR